MPLLRTGSAKSTLSMMQRRATRYERYISLASVFLIITSTIVIFTSVVLIKWYFMPNLAFWDPMFSVAPYLMLAIGIFKFVISLYGFAITSSENRGLLVFFAVLLAVAFIGQIASIFTFWQVKTKIEISSVGPSAANDELQLYGKNGSESVTRSWDHMQSHLHCCGASGYQQGYKDWQNTDFGRNKHGKYQAFDGVPDSCCHQEGENCGKGVLGTMGENQVRSRIFVDGCLEILQQWMEDDIDPMISVYSGVGIAIALVELIATVLVCAYVAQINRRRQREEMMWNAVRGDNGDGRGAEMQPMHTFDRSSNHDTPV